MLTYTLLFISAIVATTYLLQFLAYRRPRQQVTGTDFHPIVGSTESMHASASATHQERDI